MKSEIFEIPHLARICFEKNKGLVLPEKVPYLGMGSSFFAALSLRYLDVKVYPEIASEYFNYLEKSKQFERAVLISQSGFSSETLWCADRFNNFISIVNDRTTPLAQHPKSELTVDLHAGDEKYSSTKTYINTLVVLYTGHGISTLPVFESLNRRFTDLFEMGQELGERLYRLSRKRRFKGFYIVGGGPNLGTALQAALVLTESTRIPFIGMALSQYDHGPKEAAANSVVIFINPEGKQAERALKVKNRIEQAGAVCFEVTESELTEKLSPFTLIIPFFSAADWISRKLRISHPFEVGDKVTRVTS